MKTPRDLGNYVPAEEAALALESQASYVRRNADEHPLVKCAGYLHFWNPTWADAPKRPVKTRDAVASRRRQK